MMASSLSRFMEAQDAKLQTQMSHLEKVVERARSKSPAPVGHNVRATETHSEPAAKAEPSEQTGPELPISESAEQSAAKAEMVMSGGLRPGVPVFGTDYSGAPTQPIALPLTKETFGLADHLARALGTPDKPLGALPLPLTPLRGIVDGITDAVT